MPHESGSALGAPPIAVDPTRPPVGPAIDASVSVMLERLLHRVFDSSVVLSSVLSVDGSPAYVRGRLFEVIDELDAMTHDVQRAALAVHRRVGALDAGASRISRPPLPSPSPTAEVALLDRAGVIVDVNDAWRQFTAENGGDPLGCGVGTSYLDVCDRAQDEPGALEVAGAIRWALASDSPTVLKVPTSCDSPSEPRWFDVFVSSRYDGDRPVGASVVLEPAGEPRRRRSDAAPVAGPGAGDAAHELRRAQETIDQLTDALAQCRVIEQAKGVLASSYGITVDEAVDVLRTYARARRIRLRDVAASVVADGLRPERTPDGSPRSVPGPARRMR